MVPAAAAPLCVTDAHYRYRPDRPWAVQGVSLRMQPGEILGLLGPNGAGKSTLLRLVAGLLRPQVGSIERAPAPAFALVPQENAFYPRLTCRENLAFFAAAARVPPAQRPERIEACLRAAALADLADRRSEECSGGARRRLNLALGLLADPQLLLLDEPTANVDPQARAFLLDAVRELRGRGKAIVYASHYMEEVEAIADRIAIIDAGRLIVEGRLDEILGTGRRLHVRVPPDSPRAPGWDEDGAGAWSIALDDASRVAVVLADLEARGIVPGNVQFGARNLEDVFLTLTHRSLRD